MYIFFNRDLMPHVFVEINLYKIHVKFETLKDDKEIKAHQISDESDANRYASLLKSLAANCSSIAITSSCVNLL